MDLIECSNNFSELASYRRSLWKDRYHAVAVQHHLRVIPLENFHQHLAWRGVVDGNDESNLFSGLIVEHR